MADLIRSLFLAAQLLVGVATVYDGELDAPLYCDQHLSGTLTYGGVAEPWVALDVGEYLSGRFRCGDRLLVILPGREPFIARALDAGRFEGRWVEGWPRSSPIVVDLPRWLAPEGAMSWYPAVVVRLD